MYWYCGTNGGNVKIGYQLPYNCWRFCHQSSVAFISNLFATMTVFGCSSNSVAMYTTAFLIRPRVVSWQKIISMEIYLSMISMEYKLLVKAKDDDRSGNI